jgi:hypothetical protein
MSSPVVGGKKRRTTKKSGMFGLGLMSRLFGKTKKVRKSNKSRKSRKSKKSRRMYGGSRAGSLHIDPDPSGHKQYGAGGIRYHDRIENPRNKN